MSEQVNEKTIISESVKLVDTNALQIFKNTLESRIPNVKIYEIYEDWEALSEHMSKNKEAFDDYAALLAGQTDNTVRIYNFNGITLSGPIPTQYDVDGSSLVQCKFYYESGNNTVISLTTLIWNYDRYSLSMKLRVRSAIELEDTSHLCALTSVNDLLIKDNREVSTIHGLVNSDSFCVILSSCNDRTRFIE